MLNNSHLAYECFGFVLMNLHKGVNMKNFELIRPTRLSFLGFDELLNSIETILADKPSATSFPPVNILKTDDGMVIQLAVAGFTKDRLTISHAKKGNQLTVSAESVDEGPSVFLVKGIANRGFSRSFFVADDLQIKGATLDNGILSITLEKVESTESASISIQID